MAIPRTVFGIGNAIVDILSYVDEADLQKMSLTKGTMSLVDDDVLRKLELNQNVASVSAGGSVANTLVHLSTLGTCCSYTGKVATDSAGERYRAGLSQAGIKFETESLDQGISTGQCYVFITPDGQRTMCTYLGASSELTDSDVNSGEAFLAYVTLIEGYLWDAPRALSLIIECAKRAKISRNLVALSLSDPLLVTRHRTNLQWFIENYVDLIFANELEIQQLYEFEDLSQLLEITQGNPQYLVITQGEKGSTVIANGQKITCKAIPVAEVVDTTGAGDAYAAGFLHEFLKDQPIAKCMDTASLLASQVIQHIGARHVSDES